MDITQPFIELPGQPATVALPAVDSELFITIAMPVTERLENDWHTGACGCALVSGCDRYGEKWVDHAPMTWTPEAVLVALREVTAASAAQQNIATAA